MIGDTEINRRLAVTKKWASGRAQKSDRPSVFLDFFEETIRQVGADEEALYHRVDYGDSIRMAAEIEALAAWRRVRSWNTRKGLLKSRQYLERKY